MPRTARQIGNSGFYHIVARGIGKQILFEEDSDYLFFLSTIEKIKKQEPFDIIAYCLMENHFHLLLRVQSGLDRIMKRITVVYVAFFNSKYDRVGHLFQDRYKSIPIENDAYLLSVVRYIHNNPVKAGISSVDKYRWSSWHAYINGSHLVQTDFVLGMTGGVKGFLELSGIEDGLGHIDIEEKHRLSDTAAQRIIKEKLQLESGTQIQNLDRLKRDQAIRRLKQEGLSIRQIERLTGINRGIITRV